MQFGNIQSGAEIPGGFCKELSIKGFNLSSDIIDTCTIQSRTAIINARK